MTPADILAWLLTTLATLSACLLGLNLAHLGHRANRPAYLARWLGDLLIALFLTIAFASLLGAVYRVFLATNWPVHVIVIGLTILAAPLLHQNLPQFLRDEPGGASILALICSATLLLQFAAA